MSWPSPVQALFDARSPIVVRTALWATAKTLDTGTPVTLGLWDGVDDATFTIDGGSRDYYGKQGAMRFEALRFAPGTAIATHEVTLSVSPEAEQLVRGYNIRFAPVEIHSLVFDPSDFSLVGYLRQFSGLIDGAPIFTPALGGVATCTLALVSSARLGTRTESGKKSDQTQKLRGGDRFRRYGDLGVVPSDPWGAAGTSTAPRPPPTFWSGQPGGSG